MRHRRAGVLFAALTVACTSSGPRPVSAAAEEFVDASARLAFTAVLQAVTDQGLPLRHTDIAAGTLETEYVDITTYRPEGSQYPLAERLVRFAVQVTIDSAGAGTRVAIFGIYSPFRTGLTNTRRGERAIPRDHPAMSLVREVVVEMREILEGG